MITSDSSSSSLPEASCLISIILRDDKTQKSKIANSDTTTHNKEYQLNIRLKSIFGSGLDVQNGGKNMKILVIFFFLLLF